MKLYPYSPHSASAKALAQSLEIKRIRHNGKPLNMRGAAVINWGASEIKRPLLNHTIINHPDAIRKAVNKLETFKALDGEVSIPDWTESRDEAYGWLAEGSTVIVRKKLTGHSGEGIVVVEGEDNELEEAPLYTRYIRKKNEYRVHVNQGEVFFVQRKARKLGVPDDYVNWKIRNHANGFIFAHQDVEVDDVAKSQAISAVGELGLHFGAVDIVRSIDRKWYVLEVNTACGMEGETLVRYTEQMRRYE